LGAGDWAMKHPMSDKLRGVVPEASFGIDLATDDERTLRAAADELDRLHAEVERLREVANYWYNQWKQQSGFAARDAARQAQEARR
jgi:hypothetical protein